jgi:hypothetical protein
MAHLERGKSTSGASPSYSRFHRYCRQRRALYSLPGWFKRRCVIDGWRAKRVRRWRAMQGFPLNNRGDLPKENSVLISHIAFDEIEM